jgi:hypothetical protein
MINTSSTLMLAQNVVLVQEFALLAHQLKINYLQGIRKEGTACALLFNYVY